MKILRKLLQRFIYKELTTALELFWNQEENANVLGEIVNVRFR